MLFYHQGLQGCQTPLPSAACARSAAMLRGHIWSAHASEGYCWSSCFHATWLLSRCRIFHIPGPVMKVEAWHYGQHFEDDQQYRFLRQRSSLTTHHVRTAWGLGC